jgi:hypothetical protein
VVSTERKVYVGLGSLMGATLQQFKKWLRTLTPYQSLFVVSLPLLIIEPLKIFALIFAGRGHWLAGATIMIGMYGVSIFLVDRLFHVVKPQLLRLKWFATLWQKWIAFRK